MRTWDGDATYEGGRFQSYDAVQQSTDGILRLYENCPVFTYYSSTSNKDTLSMMSLTIQQPQLLLWNANSHPCWLDMFNASEEETTCTQWTLDQQKEFALQLTKCHLEELRHEMYSGTDATTKRLTELGAATYTTFLTNFQVYCAQLRHEYRVTQQLSLHSNLLSQYESLFQQGSVVLEKFMALQNLPDLLITSIQQAGNTLDSLLRDKVAPQLESYLNARLDGYMVKLDGVFDNQVSRVQNIVIDFMDNVQRQTFHAQAAQEDLLESWKTELGQHKEEMDLQRQLLGDHQNYMKSLADIVRASTLTVSKMVSSFSFIIGLSRYIEPLLFFIAHFYFIRMFNKQRGSPRRLLYVTAMLEFLVETSILLAEEELGPVKWHIRKNTVLFSTLVLIVWNVLGCLFGHPTPKEDSNPRIEEEEEIHMQYQRQLHAAATRELLETTKVLKNMLDLKRDELVASVQQEAPPHCQWSSAGTFDAKKSPTDEQMVDCVHERLHKTHRNDRESSFYDCSESTTFSVVDIPFVSPGNSSPGAENVEALQSESTDSKNRKRTATEEPKDSPTSKKHKKK